MIYGKLENNIITNIILSDNQPDGYIEISNSVSIGYELIDGVFYPPKPFPSWSLIDGVWTAPKVAPDGNYSWSEIIMDWVYSGDQKELEALKLAKNKKINETKQLRKTSISQPTPQTIIYQGNLVGKMFSVNFDKDMAAITGIIDSLQGLINSLVVNPTRGWTDIDGKRWELDIDDFKSLRTHILERDDQERKQEELKNNLINAINQEIDEQGNITKTIQEAIAEVEAFNINQIII